jgi:hypothetical protein
MTFQPNPGPPPGTPFQHGAPFSPPPRRSGVPWWGWTLGCCGVGCGLVVLLLSIGAVRLFSTVNTAMQAAMKTPVTSATVRQDLGADVPFYPRGTLDLTATQGASVGTRMVGGFTAGKLKMGVAVFNTQDEPDRVFAYYEKQLKANGWQRMTNTGGTTGGRRNGVAYEQRQYGKGQDLVMLQVQQGAGGKQVMVFRMRGVNSSGVPDR